MLLLYKTTPSFFFLLLLHLLAASRVRLLSKFTSVAALATPVSLKNIRAVSLDVTGTLVTHREPVIKSYCDAAIWARLPHPPNEEDMKAAFKVTYKERCIESPCFGGVEGISGRDWWRKTIKRVLHHCDCECDNDEQFDRFFRRIYQHFGSPKGYKILDDADIFLSSLKAQSSSSSTITTADGTSSNIKEDATLLLGITSNTPTRHMESVLPMLDNMHDQFSWFVCSQDVGFEKPAEEIFDASFKKAQFWLPDLQKHEVLHIGDSLACDYCGAKAYGFQALYLDRSDNPTITAYQDWIDAPDYPDKSEDDIKQHTINSLIDVSNMLIER